MFEDIIMHNAHNELIISLASDRSGVKLNTLFTYRMMTIIINRIRQVFSININYRSLFATLESDAYQKVK